MATTDLAYENVLFDWDGCLARTLEVWIEAYQEALANHGITRSVREITAVYGYRDNVVRMGLPQHLYEDCIAWVLQRVHAGLSEVPLYAGAVEALTLLKARGARIGLVTSSLRQVIGAPLDFHGLRQFFDIVVVNEDVANTKPDPEPLHVAMTHMGARPETTVMIGDTDHDLQAARAAGVDSVLMYPDAHRPLYDLGELQAWGPTFTCRTFDELLDVLITPQRRVHAEAH